jgi:hypothetical protein
VYGRGAESYERKKAWPSINRSIPSEYCSHQTITSNRSGSKQNPDPDFFLRPDTALPASYIPV